MSRAHVPKPAPAISVASQPTVAARRSRRLRLVDEIRGLLSRLGLGESVPASSATAAAVSRQVQPIVLPIVEDGDESVKLIEITPAIPPKVFEPTDYDHVWCLVVDKTRFTWQDAAKWIVDTRDLNVHHSDRELPTIALILKLDQLLSSELNALSSQLIPIGVLLTRWPNEAADVKEALHIISGQLRENYGEPNFDRQVRWGHSLNRHERSSVFQTV